MPVVPALVCAALLAAATRLADRRDLGAGLLAQRAGRGFQPPRLGGKPAVGRVRAHMVVVHPPALDDGAGLGQGAANLLVQALVAQLAVEALEEAGLLRLARRGVVPVDAGSVGPFQHRPAGHLGSVVADDGVGPATPGDQDVQLAGHAMAADRGVDDQGQGLAGEVVDDAQDAEAPPPAEAVGDEVQAPALVRSVRQGLGRTRAGSPLADASAAHRRAFLTGASSCPGCRPRAWAGCRAAGSRIGVADPRARPAAQHRSLRRPTATADATDQLSTRRALAMTDVPAGLGHLC